MEGGGGEIQVVLLSVFVSADSLLGPLIGIQ